MSAQDGADSLGSICVVTVGVNGIQPNSENQHFSNLSVDYSPAIEELPSLEIGFFNFFLEGGLCVPSDNF